jgi:ABC-type nitrate/sulfonate/bicarbonate transport system substrate-binding protein
MDNPTEGTKMLQRRARTRRIAAACAVVAVPFAIAACGGGGATSTPASSSADVSLQLDWTPNTNHTGFYVAREKGYYAADGINLKILPYSDASADTLVGSGTADCGITSEDNLPVASVAGTREVSVMAILQHQVNALIVPADSKYRSPKDLAGATYGGFGLPFEGPLVNAMIKNDGGTGEVKVATLNTGAYEAVYKGKVDTSLAFKTWELLEARERGIALRTFDVTDYGIPDDYNVVLACNADWLKANPQTAKRFVAATAKGFQDAIDDPRGSAKILIDANPGVFSNEKMVYASADLLAKDYYADENGVFGCQTAQRWTEYPKWLYENGILKDGSGKPLTREPDYATFYSNDYQPAGCAS